MNDILKFIYSPCIREYNKDRDFTPSQQAILIAQSEKITIEEKIDTLKHLIISYPEQEWELDTVHDEEGFEPKGLQSFLPIVRGTLQSWENALKTRYCHEGMVLYGAALRDKNTVGHKPMGGYLYTTYESSYAGLVNNKQEYLDAGDEIYGEIRRIVLDDEGPEAQYNYYNGSHEDRYLFDEDMRLIKVYVSDVHKGRIGGEDYSLLTEYSFYLPLPFKKGDIVKCTSPFITTSYGVYPYEREDPGKKYLLSMNMCLDVYIDEGDYFEFTDDTPIFSLSYCKEEDLPKEQEVLRELADIRKGKADFFGLLYRYSRRVRGTDRPRNLT